MPASSMRKNGGGNLEPIAELWAPLLRELNLENQKLHEEWVSKGLSEGPYEPITVPTPYRKWRCRRCGQLFYNADNGYRRNGRVPLYCSDKCVAAVRALAMAPVVKARSKARAAARAGRKCQTCGKAIKAKRSTMRFCSVRCRVAAHRNGSGAASDDTRLTKWKAAMQRARLSDHPGKTVADYEHRKGQESL
jgi:hypothetical protein